MKYQPNQSLHNLLWVEHGIDIKLGKTNFRIGNRCKILDKLLGSKNEQCLKIKQIIITVPFLISPHENQDNLT